MLKHTITVEFLINFFPAVSRYKTFKKEVIELFPSFPIYVATLKLGIL